MEELLRRQISLERTKTKVWGPLTRDLIDVFKQYCDGEQHLPVANLRPACNTLHLYPSTSQVHEMLVCAIEYGSPCKADHITFGEFCVLVAELRSYYLINPKMPVPYSLVRVKSDGHVQRRKRRESLAHFAVFLGGSCNPTRWRAEVAIPFFKQHGITFYNPQVQNWKPELMQLEAMAKQMAEILFFVLDSKTRAISSMIEVAYLVATQRQVVVTMCSYQCPNIQVDGNTLTDSEMLDLVKGRLILTDLVERNSVPIFNDINKALACTHVMVSRDQHVTELTEKDGAKPVKYGHLKLGRALLELREAFNSVDNSALELLSSQDVCFAYKSCTGEEMDSKWLRLRRKTQDEFDYEEFCAIVTEYKNQTQHSSLLSRLVQHIIQPFRWIISKFSSGVESEEYPDEEMRDVYLGGSAGDNLWRQTKSIPILRKHGLSYVDPSIHDWDQKLIPIHVSLREKCRLLFYVITSDRRSLGSMCEAGYYIGMGCRMVMCVYKLNSNTVIHEEQLSDCAIKDYNRGRDYLCDLASREGVPMFDDITEATNCVITMLTETQTPQPSSS